MRKGKFDLDMVDEYPDALGSTPGSAQSKPIENVTSQAPTSSTSTSHASYEGIAFSDFEKVDLRVGRITEVNEVPGAKKPLWKLTVDLGDVGTRTIVAGIKAFYTAEELVDTNIIVVVNLKPRSLAGIMSEGMLLAAENDSGDVALIRPDRDVQPGCKIR